MADGANVRARLAEAGFELVPPPAALGLYLPARKAGALVFTAGQLPLRDGSLISSGHVGGPVDEPTAVRCAEQAALNALSAASTVCDLDQVSAVVRLAGYVASASGFTRQPAVVDGASHVLIAAFGQDAGRHARLAVGVAELPMDAPVEVSLVLALGE